jgi:hypothetical protein
MGRSLGRPLFPWRRHRYFSTPAGKDARNRPQEFDKCWHTILCQRPPVQANALLALTAAEYVFSRWSLRTKALHLSVLALRQHCTKRSFSEQNREKKRTSLHFACDCLDPPARREASCAEKCGPWILIQKEILGDSRPEKPQPSPEHADDRPNTRLAGFESGRGTAAFSKRMTPSRQPHFRKAFSAAWPDSFSSQAWLCLWGSSMSYVHLRRGISCCVSDQQHLL